MTRFDTSMARFVTSMARFVTSFSRGNESSHRGIESSHWGNESSHWGNEASHRGNESSRDIMARFVTSWGNVSSRVSWAIWPKDLLSVNQIGGRRNGMQSLLYMLCSMEIASKGNCLGWCSRREIIFGGNYWRDELEVIIWREIVLGWIFLGNCLGGGVNLAPTHPPGPLSLWGVYE